jgi:hypothetical protein
MYDIFFEDDFAGELLAVTSIVIDNFHLFKKRLSLQR